MTFPTIAVALAGVLFASPVAGQDRKVIGWTSLLAGPGLMAAAFDYRESCPAGYSTHTYQDLPTQCVWISRRTFDSDLREASVKVRLKRRPLLWSGIAGAGLGTVLLLMPESARRVVDDVSVIPSGWRASKTFGW